jgi:hypothetical protein
MIFDSHDDVPAYDIKQLYPFHSHGSIIVTTRTPELLSGKVVQVKRLSDNADGVRILLARSGRANIEQGMQSRILRSIPRLRSAQIC